MKNFKIKYLFQFLLLTSIVTSFISCSDDDNSSQGTAPVIESVSAAVDIDGNPVELTPTTIGYADNVYIIQGSGFKTVQKVFFNDTDTYFNPTLVTDNTIIVTIDRDTPYANASNELRVETLNGIATFDFVVAPPAPLVTSFNSINANDGDTITIYGSFFLDPTVTFGTTPATVVSNTLTEIEVIVPAGSFHKYVTVTTISGSSTSSQAVGTAIYDDVAASFVENYLGPWDGSGFVPNTEFKVQGESSIEANYSGYTGFKFPMYGASPSTTGYRGIRVSLRSTKETGKFKVVLNNNYGAGKEVSFTNQWTTFVIPFSELGGAPATINEIVFQEFNNGGGDKLYIDDVGFVLN